MDKKEMGIKIMLENESLSDYDKVFNISMIVGSPNTMNYIRDCDGCIDIVKTLSALIKDTETNNIVDVAKLEIANFMSGDKIVSRLISVMKRDTTRTLSIQQQLAYLINLVTNMTVYNIDFHKVNLDHYNDLLLGCISFESDTVVMDHLSSLLRDLVNDLGGLQRPLGYEIWLDPSRYSRMVNGFQTEHNEGAGIIIPKLDLMRRTKRLNSIKHETFIRHTVNSISENLMDMSDNLTQEELEMTQSILDKLKERWYKMHELKSTEQEQKDINELEEPVDICVRDLEAKIEFEEITGIKQLQATIDSLSLAIERR